MIGFEAMRRQNEQSALSDAAGKQLAFANVPSPLYPLISNLQPLFAHATEVTEAWKREEDRTIKGVALLIRATPFSIHSSEYRDIALASLRLLQCVHCQLHHNRRAAG